MKEDVKTIMALVFKTSVENISDSLQQKNVTFWDSLRHLGLIVALEDKYEVAFEPEEISEMISFEKVIFYLEQKLEDK
jgi:acyl carrier protein